MLDQLDGMIDGLFQPGAHVAIAECQNESKNTNLFSTRSLNVRGLVNLSKKILLAEVFEKYNLDK